MTRKQQVGQAVAAACKVRIKGCSMREQGGMWEVVGGAQSSALCASSAQHSTAGGAAGHTCGAPIGAWQGCTVRKLTWHEAGETCPASRERGCQTGCCCLGPCNGAHNV